MVIVACCHTLPALRGLSPTPYTGSAIGIGSRDLLCRANVAFVRGTQDIGLWGALRFGHFVVEKEWPICVCVGSHRQCRRLGTSGNRVPVVCLVVTLYAQFAIELVL